MADEFSPAGLGDAIFEVLVMPFKAETAVSKGDVVVADTHTDDELVSIATAEADAVDVVGVAMEDIDAGEVGKVLVIGVIKVTATAATITAGYKVKSGADGAVVQYAPAAAAADDVDNQIIGIALQDFAASATGLIFIGAI